MALVVHASPVPSLIFSKPEVFRGPTISDLSEKLRKIGVEEIPRSLELSEDDLPALTEQPIDCQVPLIDFSLLQTDRRKLAKQIGDAARTWGCCQLINHGIPVESMQHLIAESRKYFELPAERKLKVKSFVGDNTSWKLSSLYWAESWMIHGTGSRKDIDEKILSAWPEGNTAFRNLTADYVERMQPFTKQMFQLYAEDLGLEDVDFYAKHVDSSELTIRWNYYPACPQPSTVLGAKSHTDANLITFLLQDSVGGLQVEKDGCWFDVKPIEGALVINISDGFHAWTNGLYKPVLHRALVNRNSPRLSLAGLWNVDDSTPYVAPTELVDENHPQLYKPIKAGEYKQNLITTRSKVDMSAKQKEHSKVLKGLGQLDKWKILA
ncbi:protein MpDOXC20 [Marchantia polymorpha subsp. ruderalis]